jgi:uncharacterized protein YdeI (YjbR/CyaY-like superfamily)
MAPTTGAHKGRPVVHPETRAELRAWLAEHHATSTGVWLVSWKRATGKPAVTYDDIVEEALCFGWIDSTINTLDRERSALLLTPRRPGSTWSARNKERIERLRASELMRPAGLAAVERAKADGSWTAYDAAERLEEPPDLAAALDAEPAARDHWDAFAPSSRKGILWWVMSAKRPYTRARRIIEVVAKAAEGKRAQFDP